MYVYVYIYIYILYTHTNTHIYTYICIYIYIYISINNQQDATWQRNLLFHLFIKSSTCFERHVAHHQELQLYLQSLVYIRVWGPPVVKSEWELA